MAVEATKVGLRKQDHKDRNWHSELNGGFDDASDRLALSGAGDPNGTITAWWIGQKYWDTASKVYWVAEAEDDSSWIRTIPRGMVVGYTGDPTAISDGWALCNGQTVVVGEDNVETPDLSGRFIVGYNAGDSDYNTVDPIGDARVGGEKTHVVEEENIEQFQTPSGGAHTHDLLVWNDQGPDNKARAAQGTMVQGTAVTESGGSHQHDVGQAGATPIDHRPPYYVLAWIMKL